MSTITTFNQIFEQRFTKLIKQIKVLRKHPGNKEQIKECIREAKKLKKKLRIKPDLFPTYSYITVKAAAADSIIKASDDILIESIEERDEQVTIRFTLNKQFR